MGLGPNYLLDKGCLATGATAYAQFDVVEVILNSGALATVANACRRCVTANSINAVLGVVQEALDATRLATGKAVVNVRLMGITRVKVGAGGVTALDRVKTDNAAGVVTAARTAGGTQPQPIAGIVLTTMGAGGFADMMITPGATW